MPDPLQSHKPDKLSTLSSALLKQIDGRCDQFESEWRSGASPAIEEYLDGTDGKFRVALFEELLKSELEITA